jgi:hypothetical protein
VPGQPLAFTPGPSDMGHAGLEKLMGWLCGSKLHRFTIAPLDQTNECRAGAMEDPLFVSPCISPGPLTCGARRAREIDGLVVRVKVTIDLRSRHSTKRMHAVGLWNPL